MSRFGVGPASSTRDEIKPHFISGRSTDDQAVPSPGTEHAVRFTGASQYHQVRSKQGLKTGNEQNAGTPSERGG